MSGRALLLSVFLSVSTLAIAADDGVSVRASVDRKTITIGDRIKYKIAVTCPKGTDIEKLKFKDDRIGEFEIKDAGYDKAAGWYYITAYRVGDLTIPVVDIRYKRPGTKEWSVRKTDPIKISIVSVLPKNIAASDIKDIKRPLSFREFPWPAALFALLAFAVILSIFTAYRRIMMKRLRKTAYQIAMEGLGRAREDYSQNGNIKEYYAGISDAVRRYIEEIFALKAPEMTTEEFLGSLKNSGSLNDGHKDLLKLFLGACDLVKFARYTPGRDEINSVLETAKNFIEETRPVEKSNK